MGLPSTPVLRATGVVLAVAVWAATGCAGRPPAPAVAPAPTVTTSSPTTPTTLVALAKPAVTTPSTVSAVRSAIGVVTRVQTPAPVAFLTIDDGWARDPRVVAMVRDEHLPVTVFLLTAAGRQDPGYFRSLAAAGATIEDHTLTHRRLAGLPLAIQHQEICGAADDDARTYGTRPTLFRPPYGLYDATTRQAAQACGMGAVVTWNATVNDGRVVTPGGVLQPGSILLLHFRPTLYTDLQAALAAVDAAHLRPASLESYLGVH